MRRTGFVDQSVAPGSVGPTVDEIQAQTSAILALSSTGGTITADGTEQVLYVDNEPLGCTQGVAAYIDLDNMAGGDTTVIRVYHRLNDGGGLQLLDYNSYTGADGGLR